MYVCMRVCVHVWKYLPYSLAWTLNNKNAHIQSDLFAPEDVDFFAEFIESLLELQDSRLQLLLGALSTARDSGIAQLQDRLNVLRPREQRRVQLQILRYNTTHKTVSKRPRNKQIYTLADWIPSINQ